MQLWIQLLHPNGLIMQELTYAQLAWNWIATISDAVTEALDAAFASELITQEVRSAPSSWRWPTSTSGNHLGTCISAVSATEKLFLLTQKLRNVRILMKSDGWVKRAGWRTHTNGQSSFTGPKRHDEAVAGARSDGPMRGFQTARGGWTGPPTWLEWRHKCPPEAPPVPFQGGGPGRR